MLNYFDRGQIIWVVRGLDHRTAEHIDTVDHSLTESQFDNWISGHGWQIVKIEYHGLATFVFIK